MKRLVVATLVVGALLVWNGGVVAAAPTNPPTSFTLSGTCDGQAVTVTVNDGHAGQHGQGKANPPDPYFVISGGSGVLIPVAATFVGTDASGNVIFSGSTTKGQGEMTGLQGRLIICTLSSSFTPPGGGGTITATADVTFLKPGS